MLKLATIIEDKIKPSIWDRRMKKLAEEQESKIKNQSNAIRRIRVA